jgi:hypothetical protein
LGKGGSGTGRLQVPAVGGASCGGGTGVGEQAPVAEHAQVLGRRPVSRVVRPASGLAAIGHTRGGQMAGRRRGRARCTGVRRQGGGEVLSRSGRVWGRMCGHEALSR